MSDVVNCPECGMRFAVIEEVVDDTRYVDGKLIVSVRASCAMPWYCPRCGHDFQADVMGEIEARVRRMGGYGDLP